MKRLRVHRWIAAGAIGVAVLVFPLPLRNVNKERIVAEAAACLVNAEAVRQRLSQEGHPTGWQYMAFVDSDGIKKRNLRWHLVNDTDLDCSALQGQGFQLVTGDRFRKSTEDIDWYNTNAALEITDRDPTGENDELHLRFNYYYGRLGAQGFRVRAYRCILGTWFYFEHEWVS